MTEEQREQCNALISELEEAGIQVALHEFRTTSGYRVVGMEGHRRRIQRDGEDPIALLHKMKRLFGIKPPQQQEPPPPQEETPPVQEQAPAAQEETSPEPEEAQPAQEEAQPDQ